MDGGLWRRWWRLWLHCTVRRTRPPHRTPNSVVAPLLLTSNHLHNAELMFAHSLTIRPLPTHLPTS
eukprot:5694413-Prymnesium_polylepis.1